MGNVDDGLARKGGKEGKEGRKEGNRMAAADDWCDQTASKWTANGTKTLMVICPC